MGPGSRGACHRAGRRPDPVAWPGRRRSVADSRLLQCCLQILDQIVAVLEAGREPDKAFADPEFGARLRRQPLMGGSPRMGDEAFGIAEIVRNPAKLHPLKTAEPRRLSAFAFEA